MLQTTPAEQLVQELDERAVSEHPLFVGLRNGPVNHTALWILLANLEIGISSHFVAWLARMIAVSEDKRIGSLVAKQLNDELGNGHFAEIHSVLLHRFVGGLEHWRPATADDAVLEPGRRLREAENALFQGDMYTMVGALMSGEIFANKMDRCLGDEVRRQDQIEASALRWLEVHETLEAHHAGDSIELARLIPAEEPALSTALRGAATQWDTLWHFLDDVDAQVRRIEPQRAHAHA
jgi:pyrroloquinoline quinone (PQQ) biosynthesis protein C